MKNSDLQKINVSNALTLNAATEAGATMTTELVFDADVQVGLSVAVGTRVPREGMLATGVTCANGQPIKFDENSKTPIRKTMCVFATNVQDAETAIRCNIKLLRQLAASANVKFEYSAKDKTWKLSDEIVVDNLPEYENGKYVGEAKAHRA